MVIKSALLEQRRALEEMNKKPRPSTNCRSTAIIHPLLQGPKLYYFGGNGKSYLSEFTQRVMSGKLLQLKQTQNQVIETQKQLQTVLEENRSLNSLLKKQEVALRRYEGEDAGLPRLLRAHAEEVRSLRSTVRQLKIELRTVQSHLREKEQQATSLNESLASLRLMAEKNQVFEKEKADKRIDELHNLVGELQKQNQMMARQMLLERKNQQRLLASETNKHKDTKKTLSESITMINTLETEKRVLQLAAKPCSKNQNSIVHYPKILRTRPPLPQQKTLPDCDNSRNACRNLSSERLIESRAMILQ